MRLIPGMLVNDISENGERFVIKYLERVGKGNQYWRFPKKDNICEVDTLQIKLIRPEAEWDRCSRIMDKLTRQSKTLLLIPLLTNFM